MKIGAKLLTGFVLLLALALGISYSSLTAISSLGGSLDHVVNGMATKLELVGELHTGFEEMRADSTKVGVSLLAARVAKLDGQKDAAGCSSCHTRDTVDRTRQNFLRAAEKINGNIARLETTATSKVEQALLGKMARGVRDWLTLYDRYLKLTWDHQFPAAHEIAIGKIYPVVENLDKVADQLVAEQHKVLQAANLEAQRRISLARAVAFGLIALCLLVGALVHWLVRRNNAVLRRFAVDVSDSTAKVAKSATEVFAASQSLARGSSEQSSSLSATMTSSREINVMARKSAESSLSAAGTMDQAMQSVEQVNQLLQQLTESMTLINSSSGRIHKIIKVIDGIAFQTNLLALNAAVEAARAGDAGLGFAVVADEVRSLAQRCAEAARDTTALIEESIDRSRAGRTKVDEVALAIQSVTQQCQTVKVVIHGVSSNSTDQTHAVEQVTGAIADAEQVTQAAAAAAEQTATASHELKQQSHALKRAVERLNALV
jgi:methyl-accepting chemotaxis protein